MRALVSPASLKGVLSAAEAAAALAEGLRLGGAEADELPIADGGEGTAAVLRAGVRESLAVPDAFGRLRKVSIHELDGVPLIEAGEVIPLDPARLDPLQASSAGLGKLVQRVQRDRQLIVCLGGTATMDAGTGLLDELDDLQPETTVLCDVRTRFLDAPRVFGPQKGADEQTVAVLEDRFIDVASEDFLPYACSRGSGAAGGLGAAFAFLGARLVQGASFVLARRRFRERAAAADLVITGEGKVDGTTLLGKAPQKAAKIARAAGVRCVAFGGRIEAELDGAEMVELSGDPGRTREDLVALGERLSGQA